MLKIMLLVIVSVFANAEIIKHIDRSYVFKKKNMIMCSEVKSDKIVLCIEKKDKFLSGDLYKFGNKDSFIDILFKRKIPKCNNNIRDMHSFYANINTTNSNKYIKEKGFTRVSNGNGKYKKVCQDETKYYIRVLSLEYKEEPTNSVMN